MFFDIFNSFFKRKKIDDQEQFILLTYRNHIKKILPTTYYSSDTGWGCMLRVAQMAYANLLRKKQKANVQTISTLFWDNSEMPFSIQSFTKISRNLYPSKKQFEWYTPCEVGFILKQAIQSFNLTYQVSICNDNSVFLSEISTEKENIIILIMSRIGLDSPEPQYIETLIKIMGMTHFFAILGGTPKYAHLFMKYQDGYMGFLDPHSTSKAAESQEQVLQRSGQNLSKLEWIKKQKISSSMSIMFSLGRQEIPIFWNQLKEIKTQQKEAFFLYIQQQKPEMIFEDGIIQIIDLDQRDH